MPGACFLRGSCKVFCIDTKLLPVPFLLTAIRVPPEHMQHTEGPSLSPSGQHGTCREPQCRIAAVHQVAPGWHSGNPTDRMLSRGPFHWIHKSFFCHFLYIWADNHCRSIAWTVFSVSVYVCYSREAYPLQLKHRNDTVFFWSKFDPFCKNFFQWRSCKETTALSWLSAETFYLDSNLHHQMPSAWANGKSYLLLSNCRVG